MQKTPSNLPPSCSLPVWLFITSQCIKPKFQGCAFSHLEPLSPSQRMAKGCKCFLWNKIIILALGCIYSYGHIIMVIPTIWWRSFDLGVMNYCQMMNELINRTFNFLGFLCISNEWRQANIGNSLFTRFSGNCDKEYSGWLLINIISRVGIFIIYIYIYHSNCGILCIIIYVLLWAKHFLTKQSQFYLVIYQTIKFWVAIICTYWVWYPKLRTLILGLISHYCLRKLEISLSLTMN